MTNLTLKWHPEASHDLTAIARYCNQQFNRNVARKVRDKILYSAGLLSHHPTLGIIDPLLAGCTSLEYRSLVADKYTKIIYTIHPTYIYIHLLWDVRQDENRLRQAVARRYKPAENEPPYMVNEPPAGYGLNPENEKDNSAKTGK